jgi:hypothetical protein
MQEKKDTMRTDYSDETFDTQDRPSKPRKAVYTIINREGVERGYWLRLGTAFINRDDSLTVYLNALPVNNRLHIRDVDNSNAQE